MYQNCQDSSKPREIHYKRERWKKMNKTQQPQTELATTWQGLHQYPSHALTP